MVFAGPKAALHALTCFSQNQPLNKNRKFVKINNPAESLCFKKMLIMDVLF